ncbi:MAG TPA: LemA family protein [Candidatus Binatia bacterium]|jgi:LemA protein|nr:LemA family protein [Candidatus Binatia bacterium]
MAFTLGVLAIGALCVVWYLSTFNGLIGSRYAVDQSWANVEVELKRRVDLIANLVETTKGYAAHERHALAETTALRLGRVANATEANAAEPATTQLVARLLAVAEAYPELKADAQFRALQQELSGTENRIADRRQAYNATVNAYNTRCESAPSNIVAALHQFQLKTFFDAPPEADRLPRVSLS